MRLAEFAVAIDAPPKWVLNARALLGEAGDYVAGAVERWALIRELNRDFGMELQQARDFADRALAAEGDAAGVAGVVTLHVDVQRLRSAISARMAQLNTHQVRRRAGRRPKRTNPVAAAKRYGIDVTLLQANLMQTPAQRLRQLDGMMAFRTAVRRKA